MSWKRWVYIFGVTLCFALLGAWAGELSAESSGWWSLLGACIGAALGISFAHTVPAK